MKTKNQKREEILKKFEEELKIHQAEFTERVNQHNRSGYIYLIFPSPRQYYVESQIENLKRNMRK